MRTRSSTGGQDRFGTGSCGAQSHGWSVGPVDVCKYSVTQLRRTRGSNGKLVVSRGGAGYGGGVNSSGVPAATMILQQLRPRTSTELEEPNNRSSELHNERNPQCPKAAGRQRKKEFEIES